MFCQAEREVRRGRRGRHPREVGHRPLPQNGRVRSETVRSVSPCSPGNRSRGNDWRELHLDAFEQRRLASVQLWNACLGMRQVPLLRKEVIQPHLPVRLPCYDFTPITDPTFDSSLPKGWATGFGCYRLSWCDGRCVQGPGTYSPRRC